jgi:hypothetical protein
VTTIVLIVFIQEIQIEKASLRVPLLQLHSLMLMISIQAIREQADLLKRKVVIVLRCLILNNLAPSLSMYLLLFVVFAVTAVAKTGVARLPSLEALAVLLLATRLLAVAPLG